MAKRPTTFSMRMPEDLNEKIQAYATEHNCTKAEAMSHFARTGIEVEENGLATAPPPKADADAVDPSADALNNIQKRLDALQRLPVIEQPTTAIVPVDIRDKIQAYSEEHKCSEQEALTYYARLGVQMTSEQRPATTAEVAELARRIDVLARDTQTKTDQMKQMNELLTTIRDYTKPDEIELEGELAEQEAEDVEDHELTDEERQRIADEHTRQIVSDVMGDYLSRQKAEQDAREAEQRAKKDETPMPLLPLVVVVILSLVVAIIGLIFLFLRQ